MTLQPSLILVPVMLVAYSRRRSVAATVSIILVALALALQPDRAMAAVLASGALFLALKLRERVTTFVAVCALSSFGVTLDRADTLPAAPHVDRILFTAFDLNIAAGCVVLLGAVLLFLPALLARSANGEDANTYEVFGVVWLAIVAAAAIGNYPTPIVGYGGSAIVGYFLSISFLPNPLASAGVAEPAAINNRARHDEERQALDNRGHSRLAVRGSEFRTRPDRTLATVRGS
jgi:hypothetical protein